MKEFIFKKAAACRPVGSRGKIGYGKRKLTKKHAMLQRRNLKEY